MIQRTRSESSSRTRVRSRDSSGAGGRAAKPPRRGAPPAARVTTTTAVVAAATRSDGDKDTMILYAHQCMQCSHKLLMYYCLTVFFSPIQYILLNAHIMMLYVHCMYIYGMFQTMTLKSWYLGVGGGVNLVFWPFLVCIDEAREQ